jgi:hypothetical protein
MKLGSDPCVLVAVLSCVPALAGAQQVDSTPKLGLGASSALTAYVGVAQFKHASLGTDVGVRLDLGYFGAKRVRFLVGVDYLATHINRVDSLGSRESGSGYVFTGVAETNVITSLARRVAPYVGAGVGVDAVGSTISNEQIARLYNTNVFNVHAQVGAYFRLSDHGRLQAELRGTSVRVVRRVAARLGYTWVYNGLP